MTAQFIAKLGRVISLADILGDLESFVAGVSHQPFALEGTDVDPSAIEIGPAEFDHRIVITTGRIAKVGLWTTYHRRPEELKPAPEQLPEDVRHRLEASSGWWCVADVGSFRTRASLCLAALVACSISRRNGVIIEDNDRLLPAKACEGYVSPEELLALLSRWKDAPSFEELADLFCDEVGFAAPTWPRAQAQLAELCSDE